jgi:uncharacterized protein with HEPN domain
MSFERTARLLGDVSTAVAKIAAFTTGLDRDGFLGDQKTISAVCHQLIVIGEAVKRLEHEADGPDWSGWARLRDVIAHRYDALDEERLWLVIKDEVPRLGIVARTALETLDRPPP